MKFVQIILFLVLVCFSSYFTFHIQHLTHAYIEHFEAGSYLTILIPFYIENMTNFLFSVISRTELDCIIFNTVNILFLYF